MVTGAGAVTVQALRVNDKRDSATTQEVTAALDLPPGLYWDAAAQNVVTTQPTMRTVTGNPPAMPLDRGTTKPGASVNLIGYVQTGVAGALPATFTSSMTFSTATFSTAMARTFVKV